jgi:hypothetical protein
MVEYLDKLSDDDLYLSAHVIDSKTTHVLTEAELHEIKQDLLRRKPAKITTGTVEGKMLFQLPHCPEAPQQLQNHNKALKYVPQQRWLHRTRAAHAPLS